MAFEEFLTKYQSDIYIAICSLACFVIFWLMMRFSAGRWFAIYTIKLFFLVFFLVTLLKILNSAVIDYHLSWITPTSIKVIGCVIFGIAIFWEASILIGKVESHLVKKGHEPTSIKMLSNTLKIISFCIILITIAGHLGLSMSGVLAFGGIGGIAIGMASKDMLSNVLAGVMLYFDRQFNIGDWVRSPDRNIEGTVVEIGWRLTKIMTFDHRPLFVPNSLFSSISVENPGCMTNRRISTTIGLRYEDAGKIEGIIKSINSMLSHHPEIDQKQIKLVYFDAFADSSLNIMIYCFTKTTKWASWLAAQQDVYLKIINIVKDAGADFAYPTQTILIDKD